MKFLICLRPRHGTPVLVVLGVIWVYYFSIFQAPRADHLYFLAFTGGYHNFWSMFPDIFTYPVVAGQDGFLFRPLFFLLLALTEAILGRTNFAAHQVLALILHLLVVLYLFNVIKKLSGYLLASGISIFFGVLFISQEAVIWTHETPLVLATLLSIYGIVGASRLLADEVQAGTAGRVVAALILANLIHESTLLVGLTIFVILLIYFGRSFARRAAIFLLPSLTYFLIYYSYRLSNPITARSLSEEFLSRIDIQFLVELSSSIFMSAWHWIYASFFPQAVHIKYGARLFYRTDLTLSVTQSLTEYPFQTLASLLLVSTILVSLLCARRTGREDRAFAQYRFIRDTSALVAMGVTALIVIGRYNRISTGDYFSVLTYYSYFFMAMGTLFIWGVIGSATIQTTGSNAVHSTGILSTAQTLTNYRYIIFSPRNMLLTVFIFSLTVVTLANGVKTRMVSKDAAIKNASKLLAVEAMDDFIETHRISSQHKFRMKTRVDGDELLSFLTPNEPLYLKRGFFRDLATVPPQKISFLDVIYMPFRQMDEFADAVPLSLGKHGQLINFDTDKGERMTGVHAVDMINQFNLFTCSDGKIALQTFNANVNLFPCSGTKFIGTINLKDQLLSHYLQYDGVDIVETSGLAGKNRKSLDSKDSLLLDTSFWEYFSGPLPVALEVTFPQEKKLIGYILGIGNDQPEATGRAPSSWILYSRVSEGEEWTEISRAPFVTWSPNEDKVIELHKSVHTKQLKLVVESTLEKSVMRLSHFRPLFDSN